MANSLVVMNSEVALQCSNPTSTVLFQARWFNNIVTQCQVLLFRSSFDELRSIRVAYQVYEANDTKGMRIDATTLLRTLKVKPYSNLPKRIAKTAAFCFAIIYTKLKRSKWNYLKAISHLYSFSTCSIFENSLISMDINRFSMRYRWWLL